ncbi:DUF11 domain-containing protein [Qipengyuania sp. 6B39]|uniref:DUF11 domain-containing protein n=1 Tax=Qipengyuania proteolytica TaxID=2867239 RepID=UPI001C8A2DB8|nr:DUF11 domain-containing protein [Qipengyuania proteolytica]MBX7495781.1 DUF11 domain-containing protein [Qipengyuania proteolytica]
MTFRHLLAALMALAFATLGALPVAAQTTIRADWTNLNKNNLQEVTSGERVAAGPNGVTVTTRINRDGDANDAGFTNGYSTGMLSYYSGNVGGNTGTLFYSTDHTIFDVGDYFETIYTLDTAVTNLAFTVGNVDRYFTDPYYFHDGVTIEYDTGTGTWLNLRNLTTAYTLGSTVGTTTLNGVAGFHGTGYNGGITSTTGNIAVNFGAVTVKRVRIRYLFGQGSPTANPTGSYQYIGLSDFTWQQSGVSVSDLSLTKTVSNATPTNGSTISYTLNLSNAGPLAAANVVVGDALPAGFSFVSASGYGTFNNSTGRWSVPLISSGQTRTITLTGTVTAPAGITVTNIAEVFSSPNYDPDSTPNNSVVGEDDRASVTFTVQGSRTAGVAPALICPVGSTLFDWDTRAWISGTRNNSYSVAGIGTLSFAIAGSGSWVTDPAFGGASPSLSNANNGGFAGTQLALHQYLDFATASETMTTVISLPTAVPGVQFTVFDVDYAADDFADKLVVSGSFGGTTVLPTLTNGTANYVVGNTAIGDAGSDGTTGDGNVVVTFSQPVDTITITYGNANTAPSNPDGQAIAIHDITFCNPDTEVTATKSSTVISDPVSGTDNPKAIPGAVIEYCILVSNAGSATATNLVVSDVLPTELTFVSGSILSGPGCSSATGAEDDNASGADETDPYGGSFSSNTVTARATSIAPDATFAIRFRATLD